MMRPIRLLVPVLAAGLVACMPNPSADWSPSSGSLALLDDTLFVADRDADRVVVFKVEGDTLERLTAIDFAPDHRGARAFPERLIASKDGRVFVSLRGQRRVAVLSDRSGSWRWDGEAVGLGAEPVGLALSTDGSLLLVTTRESGNLTAVETSTLNVAWRSPVGQHPHAIAVRGNEAWVTHFKTGKVSVVDLMAPESEPRIIALDAAPVDFGGEWQPTNVSAITNSVGGDRIYVAHTQSRSDGLGTSAGSGTARVVEYYAASPALPAAVVAGVSTLDPDARALLSDSQGSLVTERDIPPAFFFDSNAASTSHPLHAPSAVVAGPRGAWLYIAGQSSDSVVVTATSRGLASGDNSLGISTSFTVPGGPTGLAMSADGRRLFVHSLHAGMVSVIQAAGQNGHEVEVVADLIDGAPEWLTPQVRQGRALFHSAVDSHVTVPDGLGISCASCHPNGRDDGHTWQFFEGKRNTPLLATGQLSETAPYHWDGTITDFPRLNVIVQERMGGSGLGDSEFDAILAYLESPAVLVPDNPNVDPAGLSEPQLRGKLLFEGKAECATCHAGETLTDNSSYDVGVLDPNDQCLDTSLPCAFQTPSLRDVYTTGPWLHTGEALTLHERMSKWTRGNSGETHGLYNELTPDEQGDLLAYLKTL